MSWVFFLRSVIALIGFIALQATYAVGLGNVTISSKENMNLEARIAILMSESEVLKMGTKLQAKLAPTVDYEKFGISVPAEQIQPTITIEKDTSGRPKNILLKFDQPSSELQKAFSDIVIELDFSNGKVVRVYTLLNPQAKEIQVQPGQKMVEIAAQISPDLAGADADQILVALYRLNPKAFFAGNINRLKQGEALMLPSASMVASIPAQEAHDFMVQGYKDFKDRQSNRSSDSSIAQNNKTYQQAKLKDDFKDRLKIGSSQNSSEQSVNQAKINEDMIAQQKMLEEAQQRIAELEKNIADLKEINEKKKAEAQVVKVNSLLGQYGWILGLIGGLAISGLGIFAFMRRAAKTGPVITPPAPETYPYPVAPVFVPKPELQSFSLQELPDDVVEISSSAKSNQQAEVPSYAKELLSSIDLNLSSTPPDQLPAAPLAPMNKGPFSLDLGVGIQSPPVSTSKNLPQAELNSDEQRVRLNLARSYIKIKDLDTAKILLGDLVSLRHADPEVLDQAKQLLLEIS
jgi:pilus assembly protein FimV